MDIFFTLPPHACLWDLSKVSTMMTTKLSVKLDFARIISPKHLHRRKIVWYSSEKRPYFAHFAVLKIGLYFAKNFEKFRLEPARRYLIVVPRPVAWRCRSLFAAQFSLVCAILPICKESKQA
jgi:hypothetical protein